jgi:hypothetical protein
MNNLLTNHMVVCNQQLSQMWTLVTLWIWFWKQIIKACAIASKVRISAGKVQTITHEPLLFKKVCTWWVPKMLMLDQQARFCVDHLNWRETHFWSQQLLVTRHGYTASLQNWRVPFEMAPPRISTTKNARQSLQLAISWQVSSGILKEWFMSIFCHHVQQLMLTITVICFSIMCMQQFTRKGSGSCHKKSSCCTTKYIQTWWIWQWHWHPWAGESWTSLLTVQI